MIKRRKLRFLQGALMASFFSLSACNPTDSGQDPFKGKIPLKKASQLDSYVRLNSKKELDDIARHESSLVIVDKVGCKYCKAVLRGVKKYIENTHSLIYVCDINSVYLEALNSEENKVGKYALLYPNVTGTPTFLFYENGALKEMYDQGAKEDEVSALINKYCVNINAYSLNDFTYHIDQYHELGYYLPDLDEETDKPGFKTETLEKKIASKDDFYLLYTWRRCQDCKALREDFLDQYLIDHKDFPLYEYEVDGYYQSKRSEDEEEAKRGLKRYSDFSKKFHLTAYEGIKDAYGNAAGVVPTILHYRKDGSYTVAVYRNSGEIYKREDGTLSYRRSYYDDVKEVRSKSKVKELNPNSREYKKAKTELEARAEEKELAHIRNFFEGKE